MTEIERTDGRATFLADLSAAMQPLADGRAVLATAARRLAEHLGADGGAIARIEADGRLVVEADPARAGAASGAGVSASSLFGAGPLRQLRTGEPFVSGDLLADERVTEADRDPVARAQLRALLCVPHCRDGRLDGALAIHRRTPRPWAEEEVALAAATLERAWDAAERARELTSLRAKEARYHALLTAVDEGFCVCEMVVDENGRSVDYRFLEVNPAFEGLTGLVDPVGRTAREMVPNLEDHWVEIYGRVAFTGEPIRFQQGSEAMGRWFDVYATSVGTGKEGTFSLLFTNITERRRTEAALVAARQEADARADEAAQLAAQLQEQTAELEWQVEQSQALTRELETANETLAETNQRLVARTNALAESEARFRNMADNAPVMVWVTEADGSCTHLNRRWYEFTGQTPEGALGLGWLDATHPDDRPLAEAAFLAANARHEPFRLEYRLRCSDGTYRWAIDAAAPRFGAQGEFLGYVGSVIDIHERREMEEERERLLAQARAAQAEAEAARGATEAAGARLREIFLRAPAHIATLRGPEHRFESANPLYLQLVNRTDIVGKTVAEVLPEVVEQGFIDLLDRVYRTGEPFYASERQVFLDRAGDGTREEVFLNFVYQPLFEAGGGVGGIFVHAVDVTEQVHARRQVEQQATEMEEVQAEVEAINEELQRTNEELTERTREAEAARAEAEEANRAKSGFLATMSHELRTPLNAIGGYVELLEMELHGPVTEEQRAALDRVQRSQRHLLGLINEILNYARIETGTVHYDMADVPVRDVLAAAEGLIAPQARSRRLALSVVECPAEVQVRADADKLRQVLVNLLSNAVKFTDPDGRIDLACEVAADHVLVDVRDTGIGIPTDKLDTIFEPFVQVRSDLARPAEGTGLGLAISRDLARGMGGELTVRSTMGEGSTFTLRLPRVLVSGAEAGA